MNQYTYFVKDKKAVSREGIIESSSKSAAANVLHSRGYTIIKLEEKKKELTFSISKGISIGVLAQFTRQLSTMVTSGLPLTDSLVVLQKQTENARMQEIIAGITEDIQGGSSFATSLSKHSAIFSTAFTNVVKAGEASGTLDKVLAKLADNLEKQREFQGKIKGAMVYPAIIVIAMLLVTAIILIFVVPKLSEVYSGLDITLPLPTRILMAASGFTVRFWWLITILIIAGSIAFRRYRKTSEGALVVDTFMLKIPVFGKLNRDTSFTEFTRTLGSLVGAGVPILAALKIAGETATNATHRAAASKVAVAVEKGASLSQALESDSTFPPIIPQMVNVGEQTGKMDEVLARVSSFFELEVEQQVKNLTTALEPIIMIALGIMVALLMIAIVMPIYNITSAF